MRTTPRLIAHFKARPLTERGIGTIGLLVTLITVTAAFLVLIFTFGVVVPPGKIGVRQIYFDTVIGPKQGFSNKALLPGYHGNIPFLARIHLLPSTWMPIHFNAARSEKPGEFVLPPLTVKSSDGVTVHLDLTVTVRLRSAPDQSGQGGLYSLLVNVGTTPDQWVQLIRTSTNKHLVEALKGLTAEDFYNHKKRRPCEERGTEALQKSLASVGIEVGSVLLRRFAYENRQIEEAIFQKNLQQVEHVLGIMKRRLAEEETITAKRISDIDREISVVSKNAQVRADAIREQAQANLMKARVEGEAIVTLARAAIDKQRAQLLAETDGADMYVARQLTPILGSLKGGVISDINPYDLKRWVENLGVNSPPQQTRPSPAAVTRRVGSEQRREPAAIPSASSPTSLPNF
jgi:regulator of protease activity HflC (stomatin/prohibitin superfamily)